MLLVQPHLASLPAPGIAPPDLSEPAAAEAVTARPRRALLDTSTAGAVRAPAPPEAVRLDRTNGLSAGSAPTVADQRPIGVALVPVQAGALEQAEAIRLALGGAGLRVSVGELAAAGRADVVVVLSGSGGRPASAWYCEPGAPLSAALAAGVLATVTVGDETATGEDQRAPSEAELPCASLPQGTAAALIRLAESDGESTAAAVARGVRDFISLNASVIRRARVGPTLVWPAAGPITSWFSPSHPLGIDIGQLDGPVFAATAGTVRFAGGDACCSYGLYVVVDAADGTRTVYGHLGSLAVRTGERVRQGQPLGVVGCTGRCSGVHLHFELIRDGRREDPLRYLP